MESATENACAAAARASAAGEAAGAPPLSPSAPLSALGLRDLTRIALDLFGRRVRLRDPFSAFAASAVVWLSLVFSTVGATTGSSSGRKPPSSACTLSRGTERIASLAVCGCGPPRPRRPQVLPGVPRPRRSPVVSDFGTPLHSSPAGAGLRFHRRPTVAPHASLRAPSARCRRDFPAARDRCDFDA